MADENGRGAAADFPDGSGPGGSVGGLDDDSCADELGRQRGGVAELLYGVAGELRNRAA